MLEEIRWQFGTDVLNGRIVDDGFNGTVRRDELIGATRPQERPAPVEYRPDAAETAEVQVSHPPDASPVATESDEIDEAFSGSLLPAATDAVTRHDDCQTTTSSRRPRATPILKAVEVLMAKKNPGIGCPAGQP